MFTSLALITLLLKGAVGLSKVIFPIVLIGALEFTERGGRGVSPGGRAPAIISGALGGNKGNPRIRGVRGRGGSGVKE